MRISAKTTAWIVCFASATASAEEGRTFPPMEPLRVFNLEYRISMTRRGLSMLPTKKPAPQPRPRPSPLAGGGIGGGGASPASLCAFEEESAPDYLGTTVDRMSLPSGEAASVQERFVALFPKDDPNPPARTAHYDWLPYYEDSGMRHLGWRAVVQDVAPERNGAWTIRVRLTPMLYSRIFRHASLITDHVEETYRLEGWRIRLVSSDAEVPKPGHQHYPLAF